MSSKVVIKKKAGVSAAIATPSSRQAKEQRGGSTRAAAFVPNEEQKSAALRNLYFLLGIIIGCTATLSAASKYGVGVAGLYPLATSGNYSSVNKSSNYSNNSVNPPLLKTSSVFLRKGAQFGADLFTSFSALKHAAPNTTRQTEAPKATPNTSSAAATRGGEDKKYEGTSFLAALEQPAAAPDTASTSSSSGFKRGWVPGKPGLLDKYREQSSKDETPADLASSAPLDAAGRSRSHFEPADRKGAKRAKVLKRKERSRDEKVGIRASITAHPSALSAPRSSSSSSKNVSACCLGMFDQSSGERLDDSHIDDATRRAVPYPPLQPYHAQAQSAHPHAPPVTLTYAQALEQHLAIKSLLALPAADRLLPGTRIRLSESITKPPALPDMAKQKAAFEKESLRTHLCNGVFEAYSASWLTTKHHVLHVKSDGYNLTWVNCEMASFIHMRESNNFYANPNAEGMVVQSLDVLDFSVIHLSTFERSSKKYLRRLWKTRSEWSVEWSKIEPVKAAARALEERLSPARTGRNLTYSPEATRTVVIMPFLGGAMGAGHSELGNRFEYLKACFWSFYEFIPNIVAGVSRKEDVQWALTQSGLPFYDILLLEGLPKSASLPVGTTARTKQKLLSGEWDFDYVFFTESDQILISRQLPMMYEQLKRYPGRMLLPHRLMVYSDRIMEEVHAKKVSRTPNEWMQQSCCLERQNCQDRSSWKGIADPSVHVINYYGLYVPLGNVNYLQENYRPCKIGPYEPGFCP